MTVLRIESEEGGREVEVGATPLVIGRSDEAAIRIAEPRASREHADVRTVPGGLLLTDLGSTNGTWRGEERILRARLRPSDRFRIGETWFEVLEEAPPAAVRPRARRPAAAAGAVVPAGILLVLVLLVVRALASTRDSEVERARGRLALAEYRLASAVADPAARIDALNAYAEAWPGTEWTARAREQVDSIAPRLARESQASAALAELDGLRKDDVLGFDELRYRYEQLLDRYSDLPAAADAIRRSVRELYDVHQDALGRLVEDVRREATALAAEGEYGRASSLLTSFVERNPMAAAIREETLRTVEAEVMRAALVAYRNLLTEADGIVRDGRRAEAEALLRTRASAFSGTRFLSLLRLRADTLSDRPVRGESPREEEDLLAQRRSYYLLAQEAEELAAAGLFDRAAEQYARIGESVRIPSIREEFDRRGTELRGLAGLVVDLKRRLAEEAAAFLPVKLGDATFRVQGLKDDVVALARGGQKVFRPFPSFKPEELLALLRAARLPPAGRLLAAAWCIDLGFREDFESEILGLLEDDGVREEAGRLYARKTGRPWPEGGFVAYKGRILTRAEHAEEIHREQVARLRDRQADLFGKLSGQPVFAKKLAKLREARQKLDAAREYALALIFDEVRYFYPYQDRMAEYTIVQREVDSRVDAVREVWNDDTLYALKEDPGVKTLLREAAEVGAELASFGIDSEEFDRKVASLTMYLGLTLSVRDFFVDDAERESLEYSRKVMAFNETVASVASEMERRQVRVTNEYRLLFGRHALVLDDRLVRTARGHSEEMEREGYFSHFSPHEERRTPDLRAALEGYRASAVSENIHRGAGTPEAAHQGWCHSSGHHRNILQKFWTEMGTGLAGRNWTQNFGRTQLKTFAPEEGK